MMRPVVLALLLAGCALPLPEGWKDRWASEALLGRGDELSAAGRHAEAARAFRRVADGGGAPALRARALFELGRLANEPGNPDRDAALASGYFDRLRREYPTSPWTPYARAWSETLEDLSRARSETARVEQEVVWLRQQVRELTAASRELTRLRQRLSDAEREAASLREDIDRLKTLELELDRLRRPR